MNKITRGEFLKHAVTAGATVMLASVVSTALADEKNEQLANRVLPPDELFQRMLLANDSYETNLLQSGKQATGRKMGHDFACLAAAYTATGSRYFHHALIIPALESLIRTLMSYQAS